MDSYFIEKNQESVAIVPGALCMDDCMYPWRIKLTL